MHPIFRLVLAVVCGILITFFVISLVDGLNEKIYPSPIKHPTQLEQVKIIQSSPLPMFLIILGGWILSSFFGAYAAARVASSPHKLIAAMTVGFLLLLGGIMYFISIPQPIWFAIASCISFLLFSFLGAKAATFRNAN
ncbi:MAG TPA: hypothetical protein PLU10_07815 [Chitinophagaceae bacterium]|nr:hypothetical protein [Chitinophagaceae bacterium]